MQWNTFRDWYNDRYVRPEFFGIIGFNIWRCWSDAMHVLDLGVYQSVAASCLEEFVQEGMWASTGSEGYLHAHVDYKAWCSARGFPPAPRFERSRLVKSTTEFPKFTQQSAKAAQIKHMIFWLHSVSARIEPDGVHARTRHAMLDAFVSFENICEEHGRWLPSDAVLMLGNHMEAALVHMHALAREASQSGVFRWHLIPKCHMATHLAYDFVSSGVNPRRTTCYADEDMVGRCKKIVQRCHGRTAGRNLVMRYVILVGTRWWTKLREFRGLR